MGRSTELHTIVNKNMAARNPLRHIAVMFIDDLITQVANSQTCYKIEAEDYSFITSIAYQINEGKSLTTRQAYAIVRVMGKYTRDCALFIPTMTPAEFKSVLSSGLWKTPPRVTVQKRNEARYLGDNLVGLSYHSTTELIQEMSRLRAIWRNGVQVLGVTASNVDPLIDLLGTYRFEIDEDLESYLALCLNSKGQNSHFVADGESVVCNVCDSETLSMFLLHVVGAERI